MTAILATILGIGFLLLIHEAGHYLAARAAGIRVEVFALGFGPRLFGWRRGDTDFRIALLPLGGYVKVSGEDPSRPPRPGDLFAASVSQRLLFYAGGILMNFLFAAILLPILFLVGVPFEAPVIGSVTPGGAAWQAGLEPGDRVLSVGDREVHGFRDIATAVALADAEHKISMTIEKPLGKQQELEVIPQFDQKRGFPQLGIAPLFDLVPVPASTLEQALPQDASLISLDGFALTEIVHVRLLLDQALTSGQALTLGWEGADGSHGELVWSPTPVPSEQLPAQLGVLQINRRVAAVHGPLAGKLHVGELLLRVGTQPVRQLADVLLAIDEQGLPEMEVQGLDGTRRTLPPEPSLTLAEVAASLHLDAEDEAPYAARAGGAAAANGMQDGDRILRADNRATPSLVELREVIGNHATDSPEQPMELLIAREGNPEALALTMTLAPVPAYDYGLAFRLREEIVRSGNPITAISMGLREAKSMIGEVLTTMQKMITGDIDRRNLGGIISIGQITHTMAAAGLIPLLFFLCLISVNLGVLNLLPIPALDGGHILFALIEMIRRKPVSMRIQAGFQVVGVFLVLALILFVTTMDIQRLMS